MSDELDDLLRRTMKVLDDQVPSGYFEDLPAKTLARLEGPSSMETSPRTIDKPATAAPVPPVAPVAHDEDDPTAPTPREEDSGLHDIRSLAQTTKRRLKSTGANPTVVDDVAAQSSSWKHVALPEPARMVSLPELDQLPSKQEVLAKDKLATERAHGESPGAVTIREPFSRPATKRSRAPLAIIGIGLAAAAGIAIFMVTQKNADQAPALSKAEAPKPDERGRGAVAPSVETIAAPSGAAAGSASAQIAADTTAAAAPEAPDAKDKVEATTTTPPAKAVKGGHGKAKDVTKEAKPDKTKPTATGGGDVGSGAGASTETKKTDTKKGGGGGKEGEPSFDDLLKEAGVNDKKVDKPKLDKKSLSEADFKHGIDSVKSKAQACYKGTQGTASVKLTIAPSGSVSKVSVGGQFAGKPEADCVANAVKSASFAPWDGGPQSFTYAYLLSE
jgi:hypothetical protein